MAASNLFFVFLVLVVLFGGNRGVHAGVPVYVMLPLTTINNDGTLNDPQQLSQELQTLKSVGVDGVLSDVWFGICEADGPQQYNFTAYVQLLQLVQNAGLKFEAIMSFHQCGGNTGDDCNIPLPEWVVNVGNSNPSIWYTDREGNVDQEYISLFVDNQTLFEGRSPIQIYQDYMQAFLDAVEPFVGNTLVEVEIGMGPAGELRYPAYPENRWTFCGVGEFQCYGSYALASLAAAANAAGQPDWGEGGPDNAGSYSDYLSDAPFFQDGTYNNYASDYGQFFLGWYHQQLLNHADDVLSIANAVFGNTNLTITGKVAGIHWWYLTDSHPAELTAGYYNTNNNNAYANIAAVFKRHGVNFDFTCLEMLDSEQPSNCDCGPQELVAQTKSAAQALGVSYAGENALNRYDSTAYNTIETEATLLNYLLSRFSYLRLDSTLLEPSNLALFQQFVSTMHGLSDEDHLPSSHDGANALKQVQALNISF